MKAVVITRKIAQKVRDTVDAGLVRGVGRPIPGQMCVEAAVCFALGLPHGDDPGCVAQPLRRLKIRLNDAWWSSDTTRAAGLRRLAVAQLGSAGMLDEREFVRRVVEMTIRKAVPVGLRAASKRLAKKWPDHTAKLEAAAVRCETEGTREACQHARAIAHAATACAACACAADAADAARAASDASARDCVLTQYAEWVVEILIEMKAPGCEWLDLTPKGADL